MIKVLVMQRCDIICGISLVDIIARQEWAAIIAEEAIHGETSRQTSDATKYTLESLLHVMVRIVFKDLNHRDLRQAIRDVVR